MDARLSTTPRDKGVTTGESEVNDGFDARDALAGRLGDATVRQAVEGGA
jgi:hypothetical protein